jgi:organic radical activating enzyme
MDEITNDAGDKYKLASAGLTEIQNSRSMQTLREDFLAGKKPQNCRRCWNEERAGRTSKRMHTLDRLKHMITDQAWTADARPLMFLDLKLGNICNLKCRICGSWSSSTFAAEELANLGPNEDRKSNHHYHMLRAGAWPRENPTFWQEIEQVSEQIRYIEFTGGEPFMIQEHFDLLQGLVDRGLADRIEIHYNTNGTQWPEHAEQIWSHFKTVEIAFSIDDVGARFEYQRTGAVWSEVVENINKFRLMRARHNNIQLQVCSTVNVFNVFYLEELATWIDTQAFDFVYWNMMHEAYYFSINTLPNATKQALTEKLQQCSVSNSHQKEFLRIADFMNNGASLDGFILRMKVADLDRKRGQNLAVTEPEFAQLIDYAGPN